MTGATCSACARSVWNCDREGGEDCLAYVASMLACSAASHERAKRARPSALLYRGLQRDDQGEAVLVWLDCPACGSTLAVSPEEFLSSAKHEPSRPKLEVVR